MSFPADLVNILRNYFINGQYSDGKLFSKSIYMTGKTDGGDELLFEEVKAPIHYRISVLGGIGGMIKKGEKYLCDFDWDANINELQLSVHLENKIFQTRNWEVISYSINIGIHNLRSRTIYHYGGLLNNIISFIAESNHNENLFLFPGKLGFFSHFTDECSNWVYDIDSIPPVMNNYRYESIGLTNCFAYVDIDYIKLDEVEDHINKIASSIKRMFSFHFSENISDDDIKILRSFPNKVDKYGNDTASFHIIVRSQRSFPEPMSVKTFLEEYVPRELYDQSVYNLFQKMRIPFSKKSPGDNRVFKPVSIKDLSTELTTYNIADYFIQTYRPTYIKSDKIEESFLNRNNIKFDNPSRSTESWEGFKKEVTELFGKHIVKQWAPHIALHLATMFKSFENSYRSYKLYEFIYRSIRDDLTAFNDILTTPGKSELQLTELLYAQSVSHTPYRSWNRAEISPYHNTIPIIMGSISFNIIHLDSFRLDNGFKVTLVNNRKVDSELKNHGSIKFRDIEIKYHQGKQYQSIIIIPGSYKAKITSGNFDASSNEVITINIFEMKILASIDFNQFTLDPFDKLVVAFTN